MNPVCRDASMGDEMFTGLGECCPKLLTRRILVHSSFGQGDSPHIHIRVVSAHDVERGIPVQALGPGVVSTETVGCVRVCNRGGVN